MSNECAITHIYDRKVRKLFSHQEKQLLIHFVKDNKIVLETKTNDPKSINARKRKWEELSQLMATRGYNRDWQRLREYYQRLKCNAKTAITKYKTHLKENGTLPDDSPSECDWAIYEIIPEDFSIFRKDKTGNDSSNSEENSFDSDRPYQTDPSDEPISITVEPDDNCLANLSQQQRLDADNLKEINTSLFDVGAAKHKRHFEFEIQKEHFLAKLGESKRARLDDACKDHVASFETEIMKQKILGEIEYQKDQLQFARDKHHMEIECANLLQQKLKSELEVVAISKLKMEVELEKAKLELSLVREKMSNT